ncbi:hypothetical protein N5079_16590 [Planotetraspora sp. A-T 1434]|uniref:hypothetical protein n=1 Tax=Planotetraspora sp. A-T 1434 TaxID=2979219 RepID=UPI0021C152FE|nr:hypothetical protein [Planotetraspora sp. A-T 1434]MCT9931831.1 hypothetical protein [Planotetraspora sp. A-T 1434]
MNTPAKLGAYVVGLTVIFGGALGAGRSAGPVGSAATEAHNRPDAHSRPDAHNTHGTGDAEGPHDTGDAGGPDAGDAHGGDHSDRADAPPIPEGLQISVNGYTLSPLTSTIEPGEATDFRFTVIGPDGKPVTGYQTRHDKKLHFIVVRRDLTGFQHLHPQLLDNGVWSVRLSLPEAGPYRAFADFAPDDHEALTLGMDLNAAGDYEPKALPPVSRTATVDGYTVTLDGELNGGGSSPLTLKITKDGEPVTDLQPYLGAYGHLVALRAGDLGYLHVHPDGSPGDGRTPAGPEITFHAEVPTGGDYRLFLDFKHAGAVHTADFTARAGQAAPTASTPASAPAVTPAQQEHSDEHSGH